jgi:hypothetical protein
MPLILGFFHQFYMLDIAKNFVHLNVTHAILLMVNSLPLGGYG